MRRQDELLAIYPSRSPFTRKFILSQMEGLALAFDAEEVLEFLQRERGHQRPIIRHQALYTLTRFLPGFVRKRYSLSEPTQGVWTGYGRSLASLKRQLQRAKEEPTLREQRREAGLFVARPLAEALLRLTRDSEWTFQSEARLALAQFPLRATHAKLLKDFEKDPSDFESFLAHAFTTEGEEGEGKLVAAIRQHAPDNPSLLLLLSQVSPDRGFEALMDLSSRTDCMGRINLALALTSMKGVDHEEAVKKLISLRESWVMVYALRALEAAGKEAYIRTIRTIYATTSEPFIKSQAVRAAGGLHSQDALDLCLATLQSPLDDVKAQALESLVRLRCPIDVLQTAATPFLKSSSLRSRVNALLATAQPDDQQVAAGVTELLLSTDTISRLEAAYCLGYIQNGQALDYLCTLINNDPNLNVRLQAIKSLSKYPARHSIDALLPLLGSPEPRIVLTAARVLTRYEEREALMVSEELIATLDKSRRSFERALLYRALGVVAGKISYDGAKMVLQKGLEEKDASAVRGAVEGWIAMGGQGPDEVDQRLREIVASGEPRAAPRAVMALFNRGHTEVIAELSSMLDAGDPLVVNPALETALEIGLLIGTGELAWRFPALATELEELYGSREFDEFSSQSQMTLRRIRTLAIAPEIKDVPPEGEFAIRRSHWDPGKKSVGSPAAGIEPPKPATPGTAPKAQPLTRGIPVPARPEPVRTFSPPSQLHRLQEHLKDPVVAREALPNRFATRLSEVCYLVSDKLQGPAVLEQIVTYRSLIVPVLALLTIGLVIAGAAWSKLSPPPPPPRPLLAPAFVVGTITQKKGTSSGPLTLQQPIQNGTEISIGIHSSLRLVTHSGNTIKVNSTAQVKIERLSGADPDVVVSISRGNYAFDFRKAGELEIRYGRFKIRAEKAAFSMEEERSKFTLIVDIGNVVVEDKDGVTNSFELGDAKVLE